MWKGGENICDILPDISTTVDMFDTDIKPDIGENENMINISETKYETCETQNTENETSEVQNIKSENSETQNETGEAQNAENETVEAQIIKNETSEAQNIFDDIGYEDIEAANMLEKLLNGDDPLDRSSEELDENINYPMEIEQNYSDNFDNSQENTDNTSDTQSDKTKDRMADGDTSLSTLSAAEDDMNISGSTVSVVGDDRQEPILSDNADNNETNDKSVSQDGINRGDADKLNVMVSSAISLKCPFCSYTAASINDFEKHRNTCHSSFKRKACTHCSKVFNSASAFANHLQEHQRSKNNKEKLVLRTSPKSDNKVKLCCKICGFKDVNKLKVKKHIKEAHRSFQCGYCDLIFRFLSCCELHQKIFHGEKIDISIKNDPYTCKICRRKFTDIACYAKHMLSFHYSLSESNHIRKVTGDNDPVKLLTVLSTTADEHIAQTKYNTEDGLDPNRTTNLLRIDTYKNNILFRTNLFKAELCEDNELELESFNFDTSNRLNAPRISKVSDCVFVIKSLFDVQD